MQACLGINNCPLCKNDLTNLIEVDSILSAVHALCTNRKVTKNHYYFIWTKHAKNKTELSE